MFRDVEIYSPLQRAILGRIWTFAVTEVTALQLELRFVPGIACVAIR
jgi:hypothetical protein